MPSDSVDLCGQRTLRCKYLQFICDNYKTLDQYDWIVFMQGDPFVHSPDFIGLLESSIYWKAPFQSLKLFVCDEKLAKVFSIDVGTQSLRPTGLKCRSSWRSFSHLSRRMRPRAWKLQQHPHLPHQRQRQQRWRRYPRRSSRRQHNQLVGEGCKGT